jgi:hypothetical protein
VLTLLDQGHTDATDLCSHEYIQCTKLASNASERDDDAVIATATSSSSSAAAAEVAASSTWPPVPVFIQLSQSSSQFFNQLK